MSQQFGLILTIERESNWYSVSIFDATDTNIDKLPIAEGDGSHWRTAVGEALSKIELPETIEKKEDDDE